MANENNIQTAHCPLCGNKKSPKEPGCKKCYQRYNDEKTNQMIQDDSTMDFPSFQNWIEKKVNVRLRKLGIGI